MQTFKQFLGESDLKKWKYSGAVDYVNKLTSVFGAPSAITENRADWFNKAGFLEINVRDEQIPHNFPVDHIDFVYSNIKLEVSPEVIKQMAEVTGSIFVDGLKKEVIARCGMLIKNAVSLGFAQDMMKGKISNPKAEYARRIKGNLSPAWYKDEMGEIE